MTEQKIPKLVLGLSGRVELRQKLIMTPRVKKNMSDEEAEKRLFVPSKKKVLQR